MSERNDGGPAFPGRQLEEIRNALDEGTHRDWVEYPGMSLRDWFAGMAMQSVMVDRWYQSEDMEGKTASEVAPFVAADAYDFADAMLAERGKQE